MNESTLKEYGTLKPLVIGVKEIAGHSRMYDGVDELLVGLRAQDELRAHPLLQDAVDKAALSDRLRPLPLLCLVASQEQLSRLVAVVHFNASSFQQLTEEAFPGAYAACNRYSHLHSPYCCSMR